MVEKDNFDAKAVTKLSDLGDFMALVKEGEDPTATQRLFSYTFANWKAFQYMYYNYGWESIGDEVEDYQDLHEHYGYCHSAIGYRLFEGARTIMTAREARRRDALVLTGDAETLAQIDKNLRLGRAAEAAAVYGADGAGSAKRVFDAVRRNV